MQISIFHRIQHNSLIWQKVNYFERTTLLVLGFSDNNNFIMLIIHENLKRGIHVIKILRWFWKFSEI